MGVKCPKCSEDVPGVVPQDELTRRLGEKEAANKELRSELKALESVKAEHATWAKERAEAAAAAERSAAWQGFDHVAVAERGRFERMHKAEREAGETDKPLAEWLAESAADGAWAHAVLRAPAAKPPANEQKPPAADPKGKPPPPANGKPMTLAEIGARMQSPEYWALPKEQRDAERARLEALARSAPPG